jgi:hypothetical protein
VPGHERDLRTALRGDPGQRVALLPRRTVAQVADRIERLPGATGGDDDPDAFEVAGQRVGPTMSAGSARRPLPVSLPVSRPAAGSVTTRPRERSSATLSRVAGCSHISVCIAGKKAIGHRAVSRVLVSRSSASPCAALASRFAVAGTTSTRSASLPIRTCWTSGTSVKTPVCTGFPDSASKVAAPTKFSAASVGTTRTS